MDRIYTEDEIAFIRLLAARYQNGETSPPTEEEVVRLLDLSHERYTAIVNTMKDFGYVVWTPSGSKFFRSSDVINAEVVQELRRIEAAAKEKAKEEAEKDRVHDLTSRIRRHPTVAWTFIIALVLGFIITAASQLAQFLKAIK